MALFLPIFPGFAHFLWFALGFCVIFLGMGGWYPLYTCMSSHIHIYIYFHHDLTIMQTNVCTNGGIKHCVLVSACVNGCMIGGEW